MFLARDSMMSELFMLSPVRPSVCPSVTTRVNQSKTVEVRIMQFSPYSEDVICQVLARTGRRHYAVPLTYRGQFERRPRLFAGSRQLLSGSTVRVVYLDRGEHLPLSLGDRLTVLTNEHKKYVRCER